MWPSSELLWLCLSHKWHLVPPSVVLNCRKICACTPSSSFVKCGSTNTSWHINVHHVKKFVHMHMKCEVKHNGDIENGTFMAYNWWGIYDLMGGAFMAYNGWGIYDLRVWLWLKWVGQ